MHATSQDSVRLNDYPSVTIWNDSVKMIVYLPDSKYGYYRGTRFDWSGVISSFEYQGHQFFGNWREGMDSDPNNEITGPVNGYIAPGLGYEEAIPGGEFVRIGIGILEKPNETNYRPFSVYNFFDYGQWKICHGQDWIEFRHTLNSDSGYAYIYKKKISLSAESPGFRISYELENTGNKIIETDQFNHNFFILDGALTGPDYRITFPWNCAMDDNPRNRQNPIVEYKGNEIKFLKDHEKRDVWASLMGFSDNAKDNHFDVVNTKTGAAISVRMDMPLIQLAFWANKYSVCPETFIFLKVNPGEKQKWNAWYSVRAEQILTNEK